MGIERDKFFIGERVLFDTDVLVNGAAPSNLVGTTVLLTIAPPPDSIGNARPEVTPALTITGTHAHGEYLTVYEGWHEWRWESTGTIMSAQQGRFRVVPKNV